MYHLSNYERETIINFNEGENTASVYTHNKALRRKLEKLSQERPKDCRLFRVSHWDQAVEYYIPKSWVKVTPSRILSDERRAAMAEAARNRLQGQQTKVITGVQYHDNSVECKDTTPNPDDAETHVDKEEDAG